MQKVSGHFFRRPAAVRFAHAIASSDMADLPRVNELVSLLTETLRADEFDDVATNGLQVAPGADRNVTCMATAVTLTSRVVDAAVGRGADTILVHHGILWPGRATPIVGASRSRLAELLIHDIALIAYHLPLDAHEVLGNSVALIGEICGEESAAGNLVQPHRHLPWVWRLAGGVSLTGSASQLGAYEIRSATPAAIERLSQGRAASLTVATGKGDSALVGSVGLEGDVYLTGEISLQSHEEAADEQRAVICIGHHASEQGGVRRLGRWVREQTSVNVIDLDIPCPI